jgi:hypothetical protein
MLQEDNFVKDEQVFKTSQRTRQAISYLMSRKGSLVEV